jgi:hypothetical protein
MNLTENDIKYIFNVTVVGVVSRVDFFVNSKGLTSAFVHFEHWWTEESGSCSAWIWTTIRETGSAKLFYTDKDYLILREMLGEQIPETVYNIHQIANITSEQDARIAYLEEVIEKLLQEKEEVLSVPTATDLDIDPKPTTRYSSRKGEDYDYAADRDDYLESLNEYGFSGGHEFAPYDSWKYGIASVETDAFKLYIQDEIERSIAVRLEATSDDDSTDSARARRVKNSEELCGNN